ncbi:MAG TPA: hypothetical protein VFO71_07890 [Gemmatimonadales bacterium]|nr:hypothetical protein [Gemmatimonadales bacterium]
MIVFRDQQVRADPALLLSALRCEVERFCWGTAAAHDAAVDLLISLGILEAGLDDAIFRESDGIAAISDQLRNASSAMGHVLWHTWGGQAGAAKPWMEQVARSLEHVQRQSLPPMVQIGVPEGYAYYGVYPEMYLEAARQCQQVLGPGNAVCLGLRGIGTSLSGAVAGALEELGCRVASYTLRPRGHPFARRPVLTPQLAAAFRDARDSFFLIVDEGPGISGSSLGGTAELLGELGVEDERILLLPSWRADGSILRSWVARSRWTRHRQFVAGFEEVWLDSGRLANSLPAGRLRDVSAGAWRRELYQDPRSFPPVQPQHERRKYLLETGAAVGSGREYRLLAFVGLGKRGPPRLHRMEQLAEAGFTPPPETIVHGFLVRQFVSGVPLHAEDQADPALLNTMAAYLAHISRQFPAEPSVTETTLREMVATNIREGLGEEWLDRADARLFETRAEWCERPAALDGRMLPHEWLRTSRGFMKIDATDHHDDHFFPGCQDIAWDLAATCLEFNLDCAARTRLLRRYQELSDDRTIAARLPSHAVSYLAYRLGYATLACSTLGEDGDGKRFAAAAERYARLLRLELSPEAESWYA